MEIKLSARGRRCSACGETLYDHEEVGRQEQELAAALVERGVRTGQEFALVRKVAGFRAVEIAELFGVRPETVSRWEHGEGEIPRTAAFALGQLYVHPKLTRQSFEALAAT
ncbi:MAG TPA: type II toxin-antitoxin system MqsA family antitoxin [Kofleriaceae bacterium]|jgi:putative zinc finger/helix-turn-helix YgiT family protein|nr:type II toxin-antitoxin system MqsA family antitoxin [Kofleriaceae bacterium]